MLVIGRCNRTVEGTINTSCPWSIRSCARAIISHFAELTFFKIFFYENVQAVVGFFLKILHSFDSMVTGHRVIQFFPALRTFLALSSFALQSCLVVAPAIERG